jgi:ABC-type lipoprotein release transport system permease subunit
MNMVLTAARGILYRWKQYLFVCVALSFGFAMILVLSGLSGGMTKNVDIAAARRYGGNLFVLGHQQTPYYTPVIRDDAALLAAVRQAGISASLVSRRTSYFENSQIFFNGYAARQKVVTGIDWTVEAGVFRNLDFAAGSFEGMAGSSGILISSVTARQLQARVGDDVVLSADTMTGQRNTVRLVIKGIFVDSSIFGAKSATWTSLSSTVSSAWPPGSTRYSEFTSPIPVPRRGMLFACTRPFPGRYRCSDR